MVHFWRSFSRAITHDPAFPERIIFPKFPEGSETWWTMGNIAHMGYAQRPAIVEYKQHTHGHRGEWRTDDWFNTVYMANAQSELSPGRLRVLESRTGEPVGLYARLDARTPVLWAGGDRMISLNLGDLVLISDEGPNAEFFKQIGWLGELCHVVEIGDEIGVIPVGCIGGGCCASSEDLVIVNDEYLPEVIE
jgi:hypothetical protein